MPLPTSPSPSSTTRTARSGILLVGMVTLITVGAFEALAVATAMPVIARELDGLNLYGAAFSLTLATSVVGMVVAGTITDRVRPTGPLLVGVGIFGAGLLSAGLATSMVTLLAGRALQGLGAGMYIVALYVVVSRAFAPERRAKVFAAFSAAWVVPSLVGPMISGLIVEHLGWRWVFLAVVIIGAPAAAVIGATTWNVPAAPAGADDETATADAADDAGTTSGDTAAADSAPAGADAAPSPASPWRRTAWAVVAGCGVATLSFGSGTDGTRQVALVLVGVALTLLAGPRLLPVGTLRAARGLPTVIALRGIIAAAFFASEVFLPLILQTERGMSPANAGTILTVGAVTWALGSALRGRSRLAPALYLRLGTGLAVVGIVLVALLCFPAVPVAVAWAGWACSGFGIGMVYPTLALLVFELAPPHEHGASTSALQVCDALASAFVLAVSAMLVTTLVAQHGTPGYLVGFALTTTLAALAFAISGRVRR